MNHEYDDIIDLPPHKSLNRKQMSNYDRAAQFAPFAALTGYGDMIQETSRIVSSEIELSDNQIDELNFKLSTLKEHLDTQPQVSITYFVPDEKKEGGSYQKEFVTIIKIDALSQTITTTTSIIPIQHVIEVESDLFQGGNEIDV
ncbi:MAG: hypothetical protein IKE51_04860 [Solobacterium sp.]|nr:hypothetical protein [Solobacterium sp.]